MARLFLGDDDVNPIQHTSAPNLILIDRSRNSVSACEMGGGGIICGMHLQTAEAGAKHLSMSTRE